MYKNKHFTHGKSKILLFVRLLAFACFTCLQWYKQITNYTHDNVFVINLVRTLYNLPKHQTLSLGITGKGLPSRKLTFAQLENCNFQSSKCELKLVLFPWNKVRKESWGNCLSLDAPHFRIGNNILSARSPQQRRVSVSEPLCGRKKGPARLCTGLFLWMGHFRGRIYAARWCVMKTRRMQALFWYKNNGGSTWKRI